MLPDQARTSTHDDSLKATRRIMIRACGFAIIPGALPAIIGCTTGTHRPTTVSAVTPQTSRRSTSELLARWGTNGTELRQPAARTTPEPQARLGSPSQVSISPPANLERRNTWAKGNPNFSDMDRMSGIQRITVHHDGMNVFTSTSRTAAQARIENIRSAHRGGNGWADIGYHYAIDPAGRVWEGRPTDWQGAHVKYHNEHNLGILVMGNFERQRPNEIQLAALKQLLQSRSTAYKVPPQRVYTHRELRPTACPGRYLQPRIAAIRDTLV